MHDVPLVGTALAAVGLRRGMLLVDDCCARMAVRAEMVRKVMALGPEQLANLTEAQRVQVEQVKAWAVANNITAD